MDSKPNPRRLDKHGRPIRVGDTIRVLGIPPDVRNYEENPADEEELKTKTVFERCLNRTSRTENLEEARVKLLVGRVMGSPRYETSTFLDPEFIELASRNKVK